MALPPLTRHDQVSSHPMSVDEAMDALDEVSAGAGDGTVSLESTRLAGVKDHVVVEGNHMSMIRNVRVVSPRVPPAVPLILDRLGVKAPPRR